VRREASVNVAFAGTSTFAVAVFAGLRSSSHEVVVGLTTPDKPRGRHGTPQPSALKQALQAAGVPILQPDSLREAGVQDDLLAFRPDVLVACAYGRIVPASLLERLPGLVVHPSAVPRWRGAAPVERALMAGETELGVTTIAMSAGVDEGDVADQRSVQVPRSADAGEAYALLAPVAVASLATTLDAIAGGSVVWRPQAGEPSYAAKLDDAERRIDWSRPAPELADQVRALSPHIGAVAELGGRRVLIWRARPLAALDDEAGGDRLALPCGEGFLEVLELQEAGRRRMTTPEYLRGAGRRLLER
jgi:methionyl-tRNA formyltransferase